MLATISHNVANLNTPGYRGVRAVPSFDAQLQTVTTQADGALSQTARPLDLSLRGNGFFVVERDGTLLLVRSGAFRIDHEGQLVTASGDRVQGASGAIEMTSADVRVDANGDIWQGLQRVDQLQLVTAADPALLRPMDGGAYRYEGALAPWTGTVVQGALERANVDTAEETIRLMETTRHAESVQRAISIYDKAMDIGINRLGDN
ncbi:flagellar hook-basal body protein [Marilutibacter alkalisoli]|uniref:flagellar hook-basal body protein n=1 Tax=Marilutibacter alkalisoli TaxID=2591633 RepID=UPI001FCA0A0C|nr:flagellar hook basal-body protein [Lysobacter alkalisoli]